VSLEAIDLAIEISVRCFCDTAINGGIFTFLTVYFGEIALVTEDLPVLFNKCGRIEESLEPDLLRGKAAASSVSN
jgi:hypothetical protein